MKVALLGKRFGTEFGECYSQLVARLRQANCHLTVFKPFDVFLKDQLGIDLRADSFFETTEQLQGTDLVFSIGGDGTFLETVSYVRDLGIPIAGINSGRLGFLADISKDEVDRVLDQILDGRYNIRKLDLLEVVAEGICFEGGNFALNELALAKLDNASMITVHAWLDGEFLNSYWADGLIVATATGSTAYSLSVGGPIVHPRSSNFVISPIAPHNLTARPFVIPNDIEIKLRVNARCGKFMVSLDSRSLALDEDAEIIVRKAPFSVRVIELAGHSFYNTLRGKLMWGADRRN